MYPNGQYDGRNDLQSLGNGSHGKAYSHHEHFEPIVAVKQAYQEDHDTDTQGHVSQYLPQLFEPFPHRGFGIFGMLQHVGDFSHFGLHSRSHNNPFAPSVSDHSRRKSHIDTVSERYPGTFQNRMVLLGRDRFSRQCRFLYLQVNCFSQTDIGRDDIASIQDHDITRDQGRGINYRNLAVP